MWEWWSTLAIEGVNEIMANQSDYTGVQHLCKGFCAAWCRASRRL